MEKLINLPLLPRSIKYGYLFWKKEHDPLIRKILGNLEYVHVYLQNSYLGFKKIDWKYRRISLGYKWTKLFLHQCENVVIKKIAQDAIHITCAQKKKK